MLANCAPWLASEPCLYFKKSYSPIRNLHFFARLASASPCFIFHIDAAPQPPSITVAGRFTLVLPAKLKRPLFLPSPVFLLKSISVPHLCVSAPDATALFSTEQPHPFPLPKFQPTGVWPPGWSFPTFLAVPQAALPLAPDWP